MAHFGVVLHSSLTSTPFQSGSGFTGTGKAPFGGVDVPSSTALLDFLTPGPGSIFELQATTFTKRFPTITEQLNTNFQNIQTSFINFGEKLDTKTLGRPGESGGEIDSGRTGGNGFDFGKSFQEGLGGAGAFLSENPAALVGILAVVALLVLKSWVQSQAYFL